jgi:hypothetical protein
MRHIQTWACATLLFVCTAPVLAQDQANEIRCSGAGTTCATNFVPKFATNGGSATVNDSIMFQANSSTMGVNGNEYLTGYVQAIGGITGSVTAPGTTFGVTGSSIGSTGVGVAGIVPTFGTLASSVLGNARVGTLGDSNGFGIVATSDHSNAFLAENASSSSDFADTVVISNLGAGFPLYAASPSGSMYLDNGGNLNLSGAVNAAAKNFRIDHPLDPANKYLMHTSVESSEMINIYTGTALMDASGSATVSLPDWFEAVNGDYRYQLTAIGAPSPNLHILQEVSNNQFRIAGGQPGMKVSWQVTGVRHDAYAKAHPLEVSFDKPEEERGYYIDPQLYGAPQEMSLSAAHLAQVKRRARGKD